MVDPNAAQVEYWNGDAGERWAAGQAGVDRNLASITQALYAFAAPAAGERVVDIGCGCGTTTLRLRERVGARGRVMGLDISRPQLEVARARASGTDVSFVLADASVHPFAAEADLVISRFGVMFFADPAAAFANLRGALAPGGRLAFVCWRGPEHNPWATVPLAAARDLLPPEPPADPLAPGPFAFADDRRIRAILTAAGFADLRIEPHDDVMEVGATLTEAVDEVMTLGPLARATAGLDEATRAQVRDRMPAALAPFVTPERVAPPAGVWLVGARRGDYQSADST